MPENDEETDFIVNEGFSEIFVSQNILNLKMYLHLAIIECIKAYGLGIQHQKIDEGMVAREMAVEDARMWAEALGLIHWEKHDVTGNPKEDVEITKFNAEAEVFEKKLEKYKIELGYTDPKMELSKTDRVKIANFKMALIGKAINNSRTRDVKVLM